ncbi:MAG: hypothetical protein IT565_11540, partial [Rhodospirillales bacterium]|nr:hypothetical protein [Rhodospirillales bacterium]
AHLFAAAGDLEGEGTTLLVVARLETERDPKTAAKHYDHAISLFEQEGLVELIAIARDERTRLK